MQSAKSFIGGKEKKYFSVLFEHRPFYLISCGEVYYSEHYVIFKKMSSRPVIKWAEVNGW